MRIRSRLPLLLLACCAAACAPAAAPEPLPAAGTEVAAMRQPLDWRSLVGCYRGADGVRYALDSIPFLPIHSDGDGARLARSSVDWGRGYDTYWAIIPPDSVKLDFDYGLHGMIYRLGVRGDSLVGRSHVITDIILPGRRRPPPAFVAVREPCPPDSAFNTPPDSAQRALLFGYGAVRPTRARLAADSWGAVAPLRAWLGAHPEALRDFRMRIDLHGVFQRAADADVRANALDLVGTYRLELQRAGGPAHVFYGRTEIRPWAALRPADTATIAQEHPVGYRLRFTLSGDSARLPRPGPGRKHPDAFGDNGPDNGAIDVSLPAATSPDGTRRFRGEVRKENFIGYFYRTDPELVTWDREWSRGHDYYGMKPSEYAEFVVWPDGNVTFEQREEFAPGQVVTLRGERISGAAWEALPEPEDPIPTPPASVRLGR